MLFYYNYLIFLTSYCDPFEIEMNIHSSRCIEPNALNLPCIQKAQTSNASVFHQQCNLLPVVIIYLLKQTKTTLWMLWLSDQSALTTKERTIGGYLPTTKLSGFFMLDMMTRGEKLGVNRTWKCCQVVK